MAPGLCDLNVLFQTFLSSSVKEYLSELQLKFQSVLRNKVSKWSKN